MKHENKYYEFKTQRFSSEISERANKEAEMYSKMIPSINCKVFYLVEDYNRVNETDIPEDFDEEIKRRIVYMKTNYVKITKLRNLVGRKMISGSGEIDLRKVIDESNYWKTCTDEFKDTVDLPKESDNLRVIRNMVTDSIGSIYEVMKDDSLTPTEMILSLPDGDEIVNNEFPKCYDRGENKYGKRLKPIAMTPMFETEYISKNDLEFLEKETDGIWKKAIKIALIPKETVEEIRALNRLSAVANYSETSDKEN